MAHVSDDRDYVLKVMAERRKARHAQLEEDEKRGQAEAQGIYNVAKSMKESKEREREMATYGKGDYIVLQTTQDLLDETLREPYDHNKRASPDFVMSILGKVAKYIAPKLEGMKDTTHNELVKIATEAQHKYDEMALNVWKPDAIIDVVPHGPYTAAQDAAAIAAMEASIIAERNRIMTERKPPGVPAEITKAMLANAREADIRTDGPGPFYPTVPTPVPAHFTEMTRGDPSKNNASFKATQLMKIRDAEAMYKLLVNGIRMRNLII